jgi:hypothetical protein
MASTDASIAEKGSVKNAAMAVLRSVTIVWAFVNAYTIRLHAVEVYGRVIHEFDPWFNFRATQYLVDHGWREFFTWYDHESWYPLGRPVGTTIYPGMQFTAAGIFRALNAMGFDVSLNDVCVFIPAGFAVTATLFTALIAREAAVGKHKATAFAITAAIMAILPAHIMRSVAGGYDNESVAVTAIVATFFWWIRSLRTEQSWPFAFAAALSYGYMVAAWGGYTFVLNMVGVHAAALFLAGRFTWNLYIAYSVFYLVGTGLAVHVPVVGWTPLRSMEQMGPLFVLGLAQLAAALHAKKRVLGERDYAAFRKRAALLGAAGALAALVSLDASGLVGGLSARVRGLFVPHTHTGNPLVDSVAEHQATRGDVYWQYFDAVILFAPAGAAACAAFRPSPARTFVALYFLIAGYFSAKMMRLVLLLGPASAAAAGVALGGVVDWVAGEAAALARVADAGPGGASKKGIADEKKETPTNASVGGGKGDGKSGGGGRAERRAANAKKKKSGGASSAFRIDEAPRAAREYFAANTSVRQAIAAATLAFLVTAGRSFVSRSRVMAQADVRALHHRARVRARRRRDDPRRLPRELLVAARQHPRGRARDGVVGLRVPDRRRRQPHDARGRKHLEPRAHRAAREVPGVPGGGRAPHRQAARRLRAGLDDALRRHARGRLGKVAAHGPDRGVRVRRRQAGGLLRGRAREPERVDARVPALQAERGRDAAGRRGARALRGGVRVEEPDGPDLEGAGRGRGDQARDKRGGAQGVRRGRVVLPGAVS